MLVVANMLRELKARHSSEKIVLVSHFTKTLDLLQNLCEKNNYKCCRLDGTTQDIKRQEIVDSFNNKHSLTC